MAVATPAKWSASRRAKMASGARRPYGSQRPTERSVSVAPGEQTASGTQRRCGGRAGGVPRPCGAWSPMAVRTPTERSASHRANGQRPGSDTRWRSGRQRNGRRRAERRWRPVPGDPAAVRGRRNGQHPGPETRCGRDTGRPGGVAAVERAAPRDAAAPRARHSALQNPHPAGPSARCSAHRAQGARAAAGQAVQGGCRGLVGREVDDDSLAVLRQGERLVQQPQRTDLGVFDVL